MTDTELIRALRKSRSPVARQAAERLAAFQTTVMDLHNRATTIAAIADGLVFGTPRREAK